MNRPQFLPSETLSAQRMTEDEAKAVIELWQEEQKERERLKQLPSVPDIAEGLNIPVAEASALLQEVRARRSTSQGEAGVVMATPESQRRVKQIVLVLLALLTVLLMTFVLTRRTDVSPPPPPVAIEAPAPPAPPRPPMPGR